MLESQFILNCFKIQYVVLESLILWNESDFPIHHVIDRMFENRIHSSELASVLNEAL